MLDSQSFGSRKTIKKRGTIIIGETYKQNENERMVELEKEKVPKIETKEEKEKTF